MSKKKTDTSCPCGSGKALIDCCQPYMSGIQPVPSAEALMRSRYTAYVMKNEQYLLDSWHASTRPDSVNFDPNVQWIRLVVIKSDDNHVEFSATYRIQGKAHTLYENSRFVFEDGKWFYVDGDNSQ